MPSYALLLQAIGLMHSFAPGQFGRSLETLVFLQDRHPRAPDVLAWTAQWHLFRVFQRWTTDFEREVEHIRRHLHAAVDLDSTHPLSLALTGHIRVSIDRDVVEAETPLRKALNANPNEPMAWLFLSHALIHQGRTEEAVAALEQSFALSPLDPLTYFFDSFASSVYIGAGRFADALKCADRAVKANASHLPSLTMLIIAQKLAGRDAEASATASKYTTLRPDASVARYLASHIAPSGDIARIESQALLESGIPK